MKKDRVVPDIIKSLQNKTKLIIRSPNATRPWQHVLEPLAGYILLAQKLYGKKGFKFNGAWNFGPKRQNHLKSNFGPKKRCVVKAGGA